MAPRRGRRACNPEIQGAVRRSSTPCFFADISGTIRVIHRGTPVCKPMKYSILISFAALVLGGCVDHVGFHSSHVGFDTAVHYAQPSAIPIYGKSALRYSIYYGSDARWHYFETHHDLRIARYKVPQASLPGWRPIFPVGKGRLPVERNARGELRARD